MKASRQQTDKNSGQADSAPRTLQDIFAEALAVENPDQRREFIQTACNGNEGLRREVEELLNQTTEMGDFLESPALNTTRYREPLPKKIGPYVIHEMLGEGGCGQVYRAEQSEPIQREVALKVIRLGMDTRRVMARFETERQTLAMMDHPHIAKVLEAGATENGRPFFVMELVRGEPITIFADHHKLNVEERLGLFIQVTQAIQHAHQKGIIHRDIKPSNVLVTIQDGLPVPKVIDFGIAKAVDPILDSPGLTTELPTFLGTPAYMSPEQVNMCQSEIDTRSDLYALGVLLNELLVGRPPFEAQRLREVGYDEARRIICEDDPRKPSDLFEHDTEDNRQALASNRKTNPARLQQEIRGDLDWIILKCLEKEKHRRYATANELAADGQAFLDGDLVSARSPSTLYRLQKSWAKHRLPITAAAAVLASLLVGLGVSVWFTIRAKSAERKAVNAQLAAQRDKKRAESSAEEARLSAYVATVNLAHNSLSQNNFGQAWNLLQRNFSEGEDLRGFEWYYLREKSLGDEHLALPSQGSPILDLAFSEDETLLATATEASIQIWDIRTHALVQKLSQGARSLTFFSNDHFLASVDGDRLTFWDCRRWEAPFEALCKATEVILSPDGQQLATVGNRFSRRRSETEGLSLWDLKTWQKTHVFRQAYAPFAYSPDGGALVANTREGLALHFKNDETILPLEEVPGSRVGSWSVFSPDGRRIYSADFSPSGTPLIYAWDVKSRKLLGTSTGESLSSHHTSAIVGGVISEDVLVTGSWDHSIRIWNASDLSYVRSLLGHRNEVWELALAPSAKTLASGSKDGQVFLWSLENKEPSRELEGWRPLLFGRESDRLAAINQDRLGFFDPTTLELKESYSIESPKRTRHRTPPLSFSDDLKTFVYVNQDGEIELRNLESDRRYAIDGTGGKAWSRLSLSPMGNFLVSRVHREDESILWDLREKCQEVQKIQGDRVRFSSDESTLAILPRRGKGELQIWDVNPMNLRSTIQSENEIAIGPSFDLSPDGNQLAVSTGPGEADHAVLIWNTVSGKRIGKLEGHKQTIWALAFSPDGKTLASASDDRMLKIWNLSVQQELLSIPTETSISRLFFSPDNQWLATSPHWFTRSTKLKLYYAPRVN